MQPSKKGAIAIIKTGIRIVCIDDFAFRKGQRYGTVMVNAENGRVVDILDSRDYEEVKNWLMTFPDLEIVNRDGSRTYAKAVADAGHNCIQISDRFHLLKNMTEYAKSSLKRLLPGSVEIDLPASVVYQAEDIPKIRGKYQYSTKWDLIVAVQKMRRDGYTINQVCEIMRIGNKTVMVYEKIKEEQKEEFMKEVLVKKTVVDENQERKAALIQQAKDFLAEGYSMSKTAELLGVSERTVRRYQVADSSGHHGRTGIRKVSKLDPYKEDILKCAAKGQSSTQIFEEINKKGYTGATSSLRRFLHDYNTGAAQPFSHDQTLRIKRKDLISLLYKDIAKVKALKNEFIEEVTKTYPELNTIYEGVKSFKQILFAKKPEKLDIWINEIRSHNISELNSFITGLVNDLDAVKNSIRYEYSNGLAEGTVNKIKVIKRIMYGRCGFEMLRRKILLNNKFN